MSTTTPIRDIEEWSSPERRIGDQELLPIPNEIYLEIISNIHDRKCLGHLALTCRFFAVVAIPKMFRSISIYTRLGSSLTAAWMPAKLLSVIQANSDARAVSVLEYVQQCSVVLNKLPSTSASALRFCEDILLKCPNTRELTVSNRISPNLFQNISQLSKLSSLKLHIGGTPHCVQAADIASCASSLRLESLELHLPFSGCEKAERRIRIEDFVSLAGTPHLRKLVTNSWQLISGLASQESLPPLEVLTIQKVEDLSVAYNLISRIPTLVDLELTRVRWPGGVKRTPSLSSLEEEEAMAQESSSSSSELVFSLSPLPNLRHIVLPHHIASLFSGPHSLHCIELRRDLNDGDDSDEMHQTNNHPVQLSSSDRLLFDIPCADTVSLELTSPSVKPEESFHGKMKLWYPKLQNLNFQLMFSTDNEEEYREKMEDTFKTFLDSWGPLETLRNLRFDFVPDYNSPYKGVSDVQDDWFRNLAHKLGLESYFSNLASVEFAGVKFV
ncbi:hypothetical protein D9757_005243 [Collybiopsis confluens]|uniref:F-box domain-containing protein n=1 Tax=Collybiopsis confluens TaxID=2823264 RepID=A0A8H5HW28_9AGAR|nr:hypothetical protein D9757_005243 [Collybiopsis confluens]